jgi:AbrB family looped-hinge helix DNA binding protein
MLECISHTNRLWQSLTISSAKKGGIAVAIGKVQSRGQITLPREVRRAAQIQPGDTVTIQALGPGTVQVKILSRLTLRDLFERYPIEGPVNIAADRAKWEAEAAQEVLGDDGG